MLADAVVLLRWTDHSFSVTGFGWMALAFVAWLCWLVRNIGSER